MDSLAEELGVVAAVDHMEFALVVAVVHKQVAGAVRLELVAVLAE